MEDFPWIYVAMIFIAFVSWLHQRIQEAAAARKIRSTQRKAAAEATRRERPLARESRPLGAPPALPAPERAPSHPEFPSTPPAPAPGAEIPVPRSLRELIQTLETLSNPPAEPPAPRTVVAPPPLPAAPVVVETNPSPVPASVEKARGEQKEERAPSPASGLTSVLRRRGSLREALILKEVLDSPVSLR
jgi:hypothetical protein